MERYAGGEEIKEGIDGELIAQVMHHTFNCARLRNYLYSEQVLMNYGQRTIRLEKEHASRPVKRVVAFERFLRNISFCSGLDVCVHDYRSNMTLLNGKALMSPDMYKHTHPFCVNVKKDNQAHRACERCDFNEANEKAARFKKPFIKECHAGVVEMVVPLVASNTYLATVFLGPAQLTTSSGPNRHRAVPIISTEKLTSFGEVIAFQSDYAAEMAEMLARQTIPKKIRSEYVFNAIHYIHTHFDEPCTVEAVAKYVAVSPSRFAHLFTEEMGVAFHKYLTTFRIDKARRLLTHSLQEIGDIAEATGFCNQNYFSNIFKANTGVSPSGYRKKSRIP